MLKRKKSRAQQVAEKRIAMLADRMAILLVICNARDEDDWNPWMGEGMYEDEGSLGDHMRNMKDYKVAKEIVRLWIQKQDKKTLEELE
jgi:hypothetical protein